MAKTGEIWVGTSGWMYRNWRGRFYPPDLPTDKWFAFYSRPFRTVEINNSFYNRPSESTYRLWKKNAPVGFLYAVKAHRVLTHRKKLIAAAEILPSILDPARLLGNHLGPMLFQLPPHWHVNTERLRSFLKALPAKIRHVVEFRDPSWYVPEVRELLDEHGVGFCIHDLRGEHSPHWATGPLAYFRFHGPTSVAYAGKYGEAKLHKPAELMKELAAAGKEVFAYFNNDGEAAAIHDARTLLELIG